MNTDIVVWGTMANDIDNFEFGTLIAIRIDVV